MEFNETAKLCRLSLCLVVKRQKWGERKGNKTLTIKLTDSFRNVRTHAHQKQDTCYLAQNSRED